MGYDHLGDCSFDETTGLLFVPVEGTDDLIHSEKAVFVFDFDLQWLGWAKLRGFRGTALARPAVPQIAASWCAVRPGEALPLADAFAPDETLMPGQSLANGILFTTNDSTMAQYIMAYPLPPKDAWTKSGLARPSQRDDLRRHDRRADGWDFVRSLADAGRFVLV